MQQGGERRIFTEQVPFTNRPRIAEFDTPGHAQPSGPETPINGHQPASHVSGAFTVGITAFLAARSQLLTAIELFFADRDPVSVHTLAGNARAILEKLCRLKGIEPLTELVLRDNSRKGQRDLYAEIALYRNCFRHAGDTEARRKRDQAARDQFDDSKNEHLLYVCVEDYIRLRKTSPLPFQVYQAWYRSLHTELLKLGLVDFYTSAFPHLLEMTRLEQKKMAAAIISEISGDLELLVDPHTEPLALQD